VWNPGRIRRRRQHQRPSRGFGTFPLAM
jgi:hypothetical protein